MASQNLVISENGTRWFGSRIVTGDVTEDIEGDGISNTAHARSKLIVAFLITEPQRFALNGALRASGTGRISAGLLSPDSEFTWWVGEAFPLLRIGRRNTLSPGTHSLFIDAMTDAAWLATGIDSDASFDFQFTLEDSAPVPEPTSLALFATGSIVTGLRLA